MTTERLWYLYLIECRDHSIYTGITVDVEKRYAAHEQGKGARYTRSHPVLRLLGFTSYANRSLASQAESVIRKLPGEKKRALAIQWQEQHRGSAKQATTSLPAPANLSQTLKLPGK